MKLLPFFAIVLLVPQFALATWWNPFSWGDSKKSIESREQIKETATASSTEEWRTTLEDVTDKKEKGTAKTSENSTIKSSIVVDLQKQIESLKAENKTLNSKLDEYKIANQKYSDAEKQWGNKNLIASFQSIINGFVEVLVSTDYQNSTYNTILRTIPQSPVNYSQDLINNSKEIVKKQLYSQAEVMCQSLDKFIKVGYISSRGNDCETAQKVFDSLKVQ